MSPPAHFIANRLALDFINTAYGAGEAQRDCLEDDQAAREWLMQAGVLAQAATQVPAQLARHARALRDVASTLIAAARSGQSGDTSALNHWLAAGQRLPHVAWQPSQARFVLSEQARDDSVASLLQPVARDLADLVTGDAVAAIHQCAAHDCTLLFLDTTTSRRRRWCSMAACGNRMKVAAYRSRRPAP